MGPAVADAQQPIVTPRARSETWRRVRVGLAGIGGILLLLAVASAMLDRIARQSPQTPMSKNDLQNGVGVAPTEPMADLGVAPAPSGQPKPAAVPNAGAQK
jgi:hypothetical protein